MTSFIEVFLEQMILHLGFHQECVRLMMICVSTLKYSIRVNDKLIGLINPECGLRQRCHLSPYLFIICAHGLSAIIDKIVGSSTLHGIKISMVLRLYLIYSLLMITSSSLEPP